MYAEGRGVSQDHVRAHMWFSLFALKLTTDELPEDILTSRAASRANGTKRTHVTNPRFR